MECDFDNKTSSNFIGDGLSAEVECEITDRVGDAIRPEHSKRSISSATSQAVCNISNVLDKDASGKTQKHRPRAQKAYSDKGGNDSDKEKTGLPFAMQGDSSHVVKLAGKTTVAAKKNNPAHHQNSLTFKAPTPSNNSTTKRKGFVDLNNHAG